MKPLPCLLQVCWLWHSVHTCENPWEKSCLGTVRRLIRTKALNLDVLCSNSWSTSSMTMGKLWTFPSLLVKIIIVPLLYRCMRSSKHPTDANYYYNSPGQLVCSNGMIIVVYVTDQIALFTLAARKFSINLVNQPQQISSVLFVNRRYSQIHLLSFVSCSNIYVCGLI